eukprot:5679331-Alexandrium_andersonii.AAC.1
MNAHTRPLRSARPRPPKHQCPPKQPLPLPANCPPAAAGSTWSRLAGARRTPQSATTAPQRGQDYHPRCQ